jgi:hypothetical protein
MIVPEHANLERKLWKGLTECVGGKFDFNYGSDGKSRRDNRPLPRHRGVE